MYFETGDNGNEYFKWRHRPAGGAPTEWMTLKDDGLRVRGHRVYHEGYKPRAMDVRAFALGNSGRINDINAVLWNRPSGAYLAKAPGSSHIVVHFNVGSGSTPALQFRAEYANRGLWYRSARDNRGFEKGWEKLATLKDIRQVNNIPVGSPVPWPQATPPAGYLACSGQTFNKSAYPGLGAAYPSGKLPDLRSEFIRGLYSGRPALSLQRGAVERHKHIGGLGENGGDHFGKTSTSGHFGLGKADWDNPLQYTNNGDTWNGNHPNPAGVISNETRPRNIAFLYIVRAV